MKRTILVALVVACGAAQASEWAVVNKSSDGAVAFVDVSSIRVDGTIRRVWSKTTYAPNTEHSGDKSVSSAVVYWALNCSKQTIRVEAMTQYFADGSFDSLPTEMLPLPWAPAVPDTTQSATMTLVCSWKPK